MCYGFISTLWLLCNICVSSHLIVEPNSNNRHCHAPHDALIETVDCSLSSKQHLCTKQLLSEATSGTSTLSSVVFDVISSQQLLSCRHIILALCLTVATFAEAMVHPMLALLQSLVCHSWWALRPHKGQPYLQPAAHQGEADDLTQRLQNAQPVVCKQQQQRPHEGRQLPVSHHVQEGLAVPQHAPCNMLHQGTLEVTSQQKQSEQKHVQQLSHQQLFLQGTSLDHQPRNSSVHGAQTGELLTLPPEQSTVRPSWCFTSATCADAQATHLKLLLCAMMLAALPFLAWLKQPRHMRQWAYLQDALPAAVVAMHAPILCLLVSASYPYVLLLGHCTCPKCVRMSMLCW